jgi:signal transduction histidine kinase/DNA-binding response OmpR family regulator
MSPDDLFTDGGSTGRRMAGLDWAGTPLGPPDGWPQSLRAAVRIVLSSRYPMLLLWGPEFTQLYNDAYSALIGDKHPAALGGDVRITLAEGWDVLGPLIEDAMATGVASWVPALRLLLDRSGYREEAYFSVSHAPARDDAGRTVGILTVCSEVTEQVVGERRLRLLRELPVHAGSSGADVTQTCARLIDAVGVHPLDVPFAAVYLRDGSTLRRAACVGVDGATGSVAAALPEVLAVDGADADDPWRLRAAAGGAAGRLDDVAERLILPAGPWGDPVGAAVVQPLPSADHRQPLGVLLTGVSPNRGLDEAYRSFHELLAQQVSVAVRNTQAHQQERQRAEALAELDRVKTEFFTNVSHEFRTPLTLMLGPLADALADRRDPLDGEQRERVDTAWRNATRLLTLVNNLLTFSSLEAGRAVSTPRDVDLAELTAELAGVFRSAVERAALRLVVHCPPLPRPTAVDPAHWENIVTNLLSNALKFTFVGQIRVALESDDAEVRLTVSDTGIGIAPADLPRLFDRFHRVQGVRSRSHEGTGIGLALVRELARLQGGDVRVASRLGEGTTFTVTLPWTAVEPAAAPGNPEPAGIYGDTAQAAAREVLGWLDAAGDGSGVDPVPRPAPAGDLQDARILVADDNGDMRAYLARLLTAQRWQVETVADGQEALAAIRRRLPDLLLTDVMMPRLDGFQLLRALRQDPATRALPVVVLSARAGREAGVEGLDLGADDYVVKPFTAAELIARVRATLQRARGRGTGTRQPAALADAAAVLASGRVLEDAFRTVTEQARVLLGGVHAATVLDGADGRDPLRFDTPAPPPERPAETRDVEAVVRGRHGRRLGSLTVRVPAGRPAAGDGPVLLPSLAAMLAVLAEHGWEPGHGAQVARALQQSLLAETLPAADDWDLHGRLVPAGPDVGGDWYDVVALPGGDLLIGVGDVAGHGVGAAVTTGQVRAAVRAYAAEDPAPATVLSRVGALLGRLGSGATLFLGRLDPATGALAWCAAGHPAPVRSGPDGTAEPLPGTIAPALGTAGADFPENRTVLAPGARLLLYTGGLVADRPEALLARCGELAAAGAAARETADAVLAAAGVAARETAGAGPAGAAGSPHGDVAVLAVHRRGRAAPAPAAAAADVDDRWVYPLEPTAAAAMRRDLRAVLRGDLDPDLLDDLLVAATEAVNNAVEHAQQPTRPEVEVGLRVAGGVVRIAVQDFGTWRGRQPAMDRGRGALLMNAYGDVRVTSTATGTLVVIERRVTDPA